VERYYSYRVRGRERDAVVVWVGQDEGPDRVLTLPGTGDERVLPVFRVEGQASRFLRARSERPACPGTAVADLAAVERWLKGQADRGVPAVAVLDTWNVLEDLARGLDAWDRLPVQGAVHDSAYEKLFGDDGRDGDCIQGWTGAERTAVRTLLTAGVALWNTCPTVSRPRR
jgi:hypothetical protein